MSAPETPAKGTQAREYIVLEAERAAEDRIAWSEIGRVEASNDLQAIKQFVTEPAEGAQYVAVAMRSWNPRTPVTKTETRTSWS